MSSNFFKNGLRHTFILTIQIVEDSRSMNGSLEKTGYLMTSIKKVGGYLAEITIY